MARTPRLSGLQKDVLSLYRRCLRAARLKPVANRPNFESFTRREFTRNIALDKKDFSAIEFLLRKGQKQLEVYEAPNIRNIAGWNALKEES
jgi:succinate dehydrogenase assembly factor 1